MALGKCSHDYSIKAQSITRMAIKMIISGGQTGVDRAALDAALTNHIGHGGWCPRGRTAEDGIIDARYRLRETDSPKYAVRTRRNVRDSDGTLILYTGRLEGGTALTAQVATTLHKPVLVIDLEQPVQNMQIEDWINDNDINVLNVAGPRESKQPGVYHKAYDLLNSLFKILAANG